LNVYAVHFRQGNISESYIAEDPVDLSLDLQYMEKHLPVYRLDPDN